MSRWTDFEERLASSDPETQTRAIEDLADSFREGSAIAVAALDRGPNRYLIAERLVRLGTVCVPELERLLAKSSDTEVQELVALILLDLGSDIGTPVLFRAIKEDHDYAMLAAKSLSNHRVAKAVPIITDKLRDLDLNNVDYAITMLSALEKFGAAPPKEFVERVTAANAPWQLQTILKIKLD